MVMDIIIAGALPHTTIAGEALNYLPKAAPHLVERLETHRAQTQHIDVEALGCTPLEYYLLQAAGLPTQASSLAAYYLPADLRHFVQEEQAIYLLRLGHIALGQASASLHTADELAITPAQSLALFENAQTIFADSPYKLLAYHPEYFLVDLGPDFADANPALLPSPGLLATGFLNDWWPQDERTRPLRALLGELQMSWFTHPVNQQREAQGLRPINAAWIFGGIKASADVLARSPQLKATNSAPNSSTSSVANNNATESTATQPNSSPRTGNKANSPTTSKFRLINSLLHAHRQQDWGMWIQQLSTLDKELPAILSGQASPISNQTSEPASRIVLCGLDRLVTLTPQNWFKQALQSKKQWKTWW